MIGKGIGWNQLYVIGDLYLNNAIVDFWNLFQKSHLVWYNIPRLAIIRHTIIDEKHMKDFY